MIQADSRPRLAQKARVKFDKLTDRHMLLYPEGGLQLNPSAAAIVELCSGERSVSEVIDALAERYPGQPREAIERDTLTLLGALSDRGLVRCDP